MFRGKVVIYKTDPRTGKVYHFEREFTDPREYEDFVKSNSDLIWNFWDLRDSLSFKDFINFERWIDELIWRKLWYLEKDYNWYEELPVDISRYEYEARKIEEERKKIEEKRKKLKEALRKLESYKQQFKEAWKEDLVKSVEEDIKKVKEELKNLENQSKSKRK